MDTINLTAGARIQIMSALQIAADNYEVESNRTPLADVKALAIRKAKAFRELRAEIKATGVEK